MLSAQPPVVARYCSLTDAAMRPRAATGTPFSLAHARIAANSARSGLAGACAGTLVELRVTLPTFTFRPASMYAATALRRFLAFLAPRSIS